MAMYSANYPSANGVAFFEPSLGVPVNAAGVVGDVEHAGVVVQWVEIFARIYPHSAKMLIKYQ